MKTFNSTISRELAIAIFYDDFTGVTDDDERAIKAWYEKYNIGWVTIPNDAELLEATQCEITKLWDNCIVVLTTKLEE